MAIICPTITPTTDSSHEYRQQMETIAPFSKRIQIDLMDGDFASPKSINPIQAWWPSGIIADIHLMFRKPQNHLETLVSLKPNMVIIHAEAQGNLTGVIEHLQKLGIKAGVALLADSSVEDNRKIIMVADHVLLFAGTLGSIGGRADMKVLKKIPEVRAIRNNMEIGWDGGANESNVVALAEAGVDVINVGSAIQKSAQPKESYSSLSKLIDSTSP